MDKLTEKLADWLTFISFFFVFITTIVLNNENLFLLIFFSILLLISLFLRSFILDEKKGSIYKISFFVELIIIFFISYYDKTNISQIYYLVNISFGVIYFSNKKSIIYSLLAFLSFIFSLFLKGNITDLLDLSVSLFVNAMPFIVVYFFMYMIKHQIIQKDIILKTKEELENKNRMLHESHKVLRELALVKERNRIAGEIHDTVGHTLTTIIVELEAAKRLINKNNELAKEKLVLAQEQLKKGLDEIRFSVKKIGLNDFSLDLKNKLKNLIKETEKHTEIVINNEINLYSQFDEKINKILINALKEGLTNGIKHGKASIFNLSIEEKTEKIHFKLTNNGIKDNSINLGFGLTNMNKMIDSINGYLKISSVEEEGFTLYIKIPKFIS